MRPRLLVALAALLVVGMVGADQAAAAAPTSPPLSFRWSSGYGVATGAAAAETCTSNCQTGASSPAAGGFASPEGVAALGSGTSERVFVTDTANNRINVLKADGSFVEAFGSGVIDGASAFETCTTATGCQQGAFGVGPGAMEGPQGLAADTAGHLYVSDSGNARIDEFSMSGNSVSFIRAFGIGVTDGAGTLETCTSSCQGGTGSGAAGGLDGPAGLALDGSGHLYAADAFNDRVDEFDVSGSSAAFVRAWGWGVAGPGAFGTCTSSCAPGSNGGGAAGGLDTPAGVAIDPTSGDVVVADSEQNRVQVFTPTGGFLRAFGVGVSDGSMTTPETCTASCQAGQSVSGAGGMGSPNDVLVTAAGDVLVSDTLGNRIDAFRLSDGSFEAAWGYAVTGSGFPQFESCTTTCVSGGTNGADGALNVPDGMALDGNGTLFVADRGDYRANAYDTGTGQLILTVSGDNSPSPMLSGGGADPGSTVDINVLGQHGSATLTPTAGSDGSFTYTITDADGLAPGSYVAQATEGHHAASPGVTFTVTSGSGTTTTTTTTSSSSSTTTSTTTTSSSSSSSSTSSGSAPVADTMQPSFVSSSEINLVGSIGSAGGLDTHYYFQWGPDLYHMPNDVPAPPGRDIGTGAPYTATETLSGLTPNTTYCFRLVAANAAGTTYAHDAGSGDPGTNRGLCAQTSGPPIAPRASTGDSTPFSSAAHPTGTAESLSGTVNPENQPTTWWFQYSVYPDLSGAGGGQPADVAGEVPARAPGASLPQVDTSDHAVGTLLTGLAPGKRYYYRLVAENNTGTTYDDAPYGGSPHRSFVTDTGAARVSGGFMDANGNSVDGGNLQEHDSVRFFWYCSTAVAGVSGVATCHVSGPFSSNVGAGTVDLTTDQPGQHTIRVDETSTSGATTSQSFSYTVKPPPSPDQQAGSVSQDASSELATVERLADSGVLCRWVYSGSVKSGVYCPGPGGAFGGTLYAEPGYTVVSGPMKVGSGGQLISDKGLGVIAAGAGNVIAAGAGNVIAAGAGNVIAAGAGNVTVLVKSGLLSITKDSLISDKGLGVIAAGAGNIFASGNEANLVAAATNAVIAAGAGNVIAAGAGNVIAAGAGNMIMAALSGASIAAAANAVAGLTQVSSLIPGNLNGLIAASGGAVINAGAHNAGDVTSGSSASAIAAAARVRRAPRTVTLATGHVTFLHGGQRLGLLLLWTKTGSKVLAHLQSENAQRRTHHKRLISLRVTIAQTFNPKGRGKTVRVTKTFTITPGKHATKKKK